MQVKSMEITQRSSASIGPSQAKENHTGGITSGIPLNRGSIPLNLGTDGVRDSVVCYRAVMPVIDATENRRSKTVNCK